MLYSLYGLIISGVDFLTEIPSDTHEEADVCVQYVSPTKPLTPPSHWFMQWHLPEGELWLSFAKVDGGYLLRFNELANFFLSDEGKEIVCTPKPEIPQDTIQHLLLDQVIPLVVNLKGGEALHVSAVLMPQGVIAFAGPSGSGKSTLVGSFVSLGYAFVSDDCLSLVKKEENIYGVPAYPGLRLWKDALSNLFRDNGANESVAHYTTKQRIWFEKKPESYCSEPQPLTAIYILSNSSEVRKKSDIVIEPLSPRESFIALVRCAFRLDITDRDMLTRQFRFLERVASRVSVRRLIYPREFNLLPAVRGAILNDLQDLDN
jgi:hypothetical protein